MEFILLIFALLVLLFSAVIHEVSHGQVAYFLGDPTAKYAGRLTLNPIKHLDPVGSIILPLLLILLRSPILFGYAKPVPFNPYNLRDQKWGPAKIAVAGPAANLFIALVFGGFSRILPISHEMKENIVSASLRGNFEVVLSLLQNSPLTSLFLIFSIIVFLNVLLAIFNLIPIPPLDGSKVLYTLLPPHLENVKFYLEMYGVFILMFFLFLVISGAIPLFPLIFIVFKFFIGI